MAARRRAVSIDDLYRLRFVSDAQISPDGTQVVYVVAWADADGSRYRSQLMLVPADASQPPRALTGGRHRDTSPRWSPDGRRLAFVSDRGEDEGRQIYVLSMDGGEPQPVTSLDKHGAGTPVWSPGGDRLAFAARTDDPDVAPREGQSDERGKPPRVKIITRVQHKADGEGFLEATRRHLFVVKPGEQARQVTDGDWDDTDPAWSPDGQWLAFVSNRERDRDLTLLSDVWVVSSNGGRARRLTAHKGQAAAPAWSPDGQRVAYLGHERGWTYGARTELLVVPATGGASEPASGADDEIGNAALTDARDPSPAVAPRWLPDGNSLMAMVSSQGRVSVVRFYLAGTQRALVGGEREVASFSASADGKRIAYTASDPTHPYEVFVDDRQLSHENDAWLQEVNLIPPEPLDVRSTDGETVYGWLMRPGGRQKSPLILEVHGGPEAMYAWSFMHEFQVLVGRGYAVLYTNPRGSKGYGEAFTSRIFADWGNQDAADCLAAVEATAALPGIDSSRLGLAGGSYGGFMTAWLIGHSDRFRAAVAMRGCYNFASFYGTSDIGPWFGDYILGGPVYEREALYRERSPLTYAAQMRTPLLLIHSESDLRCPIEQAEQLFVQLRRLGQVQTELIRFPEESHNLSRSGRPDRRVERLEQIVGWFDRFLGATPSGRAPQQAGATPAARTASPTRRRPRAGAPRPDRSPRPSQSPARRG